MSWKCTNCGRPNDDDAIRCACQQRRSAGSSASMPRRVKIVVAIVFSACMIAGMFIVGPMGFIPGAFAAIMVLFVLGMLWMSITLVAERQWADVRLLVKIAAGLAVFAVPGYLLIGVGGIFGGVGIAICLFGLFYYMNELSSGDDPDISKIGDAGRTVLVLVVLIVFCLIVWREWNDQFEKTGKRWHVAVPMNEDTKNPHMRGKESLSDRVVPEEKAASSAR